MKLATATLATSALAQYPIKGIEWETTKVVKKCSSEGMFNEIVADFEMQPVSGVWISFDTSVTPVKEIMGTRAIVKIDTKKKNKFVKCKPINKAALKKATTDGDIMTFWASCKGMTFDAEQVSFQSKKCPTFFAAGVETDVACEDGFELVDGECVDINECFDNPCDNTATCVNSQGSFECICQEGFQKVDGECVDIDECEGQGCAGDAACTNTYGGYVCQCDGYGDGYLGCVDWAACHPGQDHSECDNCAIYDSTNANLTLSTYWNDTDTSCTFEYTIDEFNSDLGSSWNLAVSLPWVAEISGVWRADNVDEVLGQVHTLYPAWFNNEGLTTDFKFHATVEQTCDSAVGISEFVTLTYCYSDPVEEEPVEEERQLFETEAPVTVGPWVAPTEPPVVLSEEICVSLAVKETNSWDDADGMHKQQLTLSFQEDDNSKMVNWRAVMNVDNIHKMTSWNADWDAESATLTPKDYNNDIDNGAFKLGVIVCSDPEDPVDFSNAQFCFKIES